MEIEMKRICTILLALAAIEYAASAQEISYALPSTSVTVKVEIRQETFFAGPYAAFAKQMLNMSVNDQDAVTSEIVGIQLIPRVEADPKAWYTTEMESAALLALTSQGLVSMGGSGHDNHVAWRFLPGLSADFSDKEIANTEKEATEIIYQKVQTDTAVVTIPVEHKVLVEKTLEDKASDAADMILALRKDRLNIATGNTDASYSGESMATALRELDRLEEEYLALFRGYSVIRKQFYTFEVVPSVSVKNHRYLVFRLTDEGPVTDGIKGTPYYLELHPEGEIPAEESQNQRRVKGTVRYRIPVTCRVDFTCDGKSMLSTRLPFYQLGAENLLYLAK